jgi:hypothetical protein
MTRAVELKPAPRVVRVGGRCMIQHPVHGKFLMQALSPEHVRIASARLATAYAESLGYHVMHDPTRWAPLPTPA